MNHHADKLDYQDGASRDPDLGGVVTEVHSCPDCGNVETQVSAS
jgi:hypothetical protein